MNNKSIKCYVTFFALLGAMFAKSMFEKRKPTPFSNRIHSDNPLLTTSELGWCVKVLYLNPVYLEDSAPQHFRSAVRKTCFHEVLLRRFFFVFPDVHSLRFNYGCLAFALIIYEYKAACQPVTSLGLIFFTFIFFLKDSYTISIYHAFGSVCVIGNFPLVYNLKHTYAKYSNQNTYC